MIPNPSQDSNLLKEHQFYAKTEVSMPLTSLDLSSVTIGEVAHNVVTFDSEHVFGIDNFLRLFILLSLIAIVVGVSRAFRRHRSFIGKEKSKSTIV
ncbi:uncharacterized protein LODBEIA_P55430 [Lodderomyces beijingensis]|uniref:Uncharacterized protein n=1 Tax=Lodderomyces beijingensis TaxID=1775926 RepID=A0ABP0ZT54_9ASCO